MDDATIVRNYYNEAAEKEWGRIDGRAEFILTCRFLDRYIKPGVTVLDIGGGPGRYSLYLAEKGCDVTLFDLSDENVRLASERGLKTIRGDAREADSLISSAFDHVLLMGPLYHLTDEHDRVRAVEAALCLLKPGGVLYASFILMFSGMIYAMKREPDMITREAEAPFIDAVLDNGSYGGMAFTQAYFISQREVLPFMERFGLEKLHLFGQEGIMSPCEQNIMSQPDEVKNAWLDISEKLCEREELLSWAEHLMYIGRKPI